MSQDEMKDLQKAIQELGYTWEAGPTTLSELPPEQQERRLGLSLVPEELERIAAEMTREAVRAAEYPAGWDWRDVDGANWTTPIRDQQSCGSCVAFGTVSVLETMVKRHHDDASLAPNLSEAHLFFCGCGNCCDRGWWPSYALDYAEENGVPDEGCFPYQPHDMPCSNTCTDWQSRAVKVASWQELVDTGARKEWLATKGPVIGCMAVYRDFFSYSSGVYRQTSRDLAGYHAIGVVGYSEAEQCWICKNSWGINWGDDGWFKIGYGECGIDDRFAMYGVESVSLPEPTPPPPPPPPPPEPNGCDPVARIKRALGGS